MPDSDFEFSPELDFIRKINTKIYEAAVHARVDVHHEQLFMRIPLTLRLTPRAIEKRLVGPRQVVKGCQAALEQTMARNSLGTDIEALAPEKLRLQTDSIWLQESTDSLNQAGQTLEEVRTMIAGASSTEKPEGLLREVVGHLRDWALWSSDAPCKDGIEILKTVAGAVEKSAALIPSTHKRARSFAKQHWVPLIDAANAKIDSQVIENDATLYSNTLRIEHIEHALIQYTNLAVAQFEVDRLYRATDLVLGVWKRELYDAAHAKSSEAIVGLNALDPNELTGVKIEDYIEQIADAAREDLGIATSHARDHGETGLSL